MDQHNNGKIFPLERFDRIDTEIKDLRDDLATAIRELTGSVTRLADKIENSTKQSQQTMPIKVVFWMFLILVLSLAGIDGVISIFKLKTILAP